MSLQEEMREKLLKLRGVSSKMPKVSKEAVAAAALTLSSSFMLNQNAENKDNSDLFEKTPTQTEVAATPPQQAQETIEFSDVVAFNRKNAEQIPNEVKGFDEVKTAEVSQNQPPELATIPVADENAAANKIETEEETYDFYDSFLYDLEQDGYNKQETDAEVIGSLYEKACEVLLIERINRIPEQEIVETMNQFSQMIENLENGKGIDKNTLKELKKKSNQANKLLGASKRDLGKSAKAAKKAQEGKLPTLKEQKKTIEKAKRVATKNVKNYEEKHNIKELVAENTTDDEKKFPLPFLNKLLGHGME